MRSCRRGLLHDREPVHGARQVLLAELHRPVHLGERVVVELARLLIDGCAHEDRVLCANELPRGVVRHEDAARRIGVLRQVLGHAQDGTELQGEPGAVDRFGRHLDVGDGAPAAAADVTGADRDGRDRRAGCQEGDNIEKTDDLIYLIDETAYEIEVSVSEVDCMEVEVGQQAEVELDILDNEVFSGKVAEVADYAIAESNVVTVPVTIRIDEVSEFFKPGFSASAEIIVSSVENVLLVPVTSVSTTGRDSVVLKVEGGKAVPTPVKTGISDSYYLEVTEGLKEGDKIIINNYQMNTTNSDNNRGPNRGGFPIPMMHQ